MFMISFNCYATVNVDLILDKMDSLYRSKSSKAKMKMSIFHPDWSREMVMDVWTKGLEKSFITILSPNKDKGISTLKIENEMWNYFPKINKVIKVPPSMMMGSWMGSDFTNDDLVKENTYRQDHTSRLINETNQYYEIELIPKKDTVSVWGKIILKVEKVKLIPLEEIFFDEKNEKIRVLVFDNVKKISSREIPMRLVLTPLKKTGQKTIVEYLEIEFDIKIDDMIFGRTNLQKRR